LSTVVLKRRYIAQMPRENAQKELRGEYGFVYYCEPRPSADMSGLTFNFTYFTPRNAHTDPNSKLNPNPH